MIECDICEMVVEQGQFTITDQYQQGQFISGGWLLCFDCYLGEVAIGNFDDVNNLCENINRNIRDEQ